MGGQSLFYFTKILKVLSRRPAGEIQSRIKLLSNICQKPNVKQLLQSQIRLLNKVPGPFKIFRASSLPNQIVEQEFNTDKTVHSYNVAHSIHILLFALKIFCAFNSAFLLDGSQLNGDLITGYITWFVVFSLGHLMFLSVRQKHSQFVLLINTIFTIEAVKNSPAVKLVVWNTPFVYIFANIFFVILIMVADIDPINHWSHLHFSQSWPFVYATQKFLFIVYNTWNYSLVTGLICTIMYNGLYLSYIALSVLSTQLHEKYTQKPNSFYSFHNGIQQYRQLEIYTKLINSCFENVAFPVKIVYITLGILLGVVICQPKIRAATSITSFGFCFYIYVCVLFFLTVGYYFPGQCNETSRKIHRACKREMAYLLKVSVVTRHDRRVSRMMIQACKDMRIRFGSSNYYERNTALNIFNLLIEKTVTLVLLF